MESSNVIYDFKRADVDIDEIKDILVKKGILNEENSVLLLDGWFGGTGKWIPMTFDVDISLLYLIRKNKDTEVYSNGNVKGETLRFMNNYVGCINPVIIDTLGQCWKYNEPILTSDGGPLITLFKKNKYVKVSGL